jgi:hypothetical protein
LDIPDETLAIEQHDRKRTLLHSSGISVYAPFHPEWRVARVHQPRHRVTWRKWSRDVA